MDQGVAIVGAGYAGLAAAVTLAAAGVPVTVFESGPVPGGRARRVSTDGFEVDNGQHILVGAYTALLGLMETVGVGADALLRVPLDLRYADGFRFRGPADLVLPGRLPLAERWRAVRFMLALRATRFRLPAEETVSTLLRRHGQEGMIGHYVWKPLCVSALNTPPEEASAQVFANVLRDSVAGPAGASDLLLPRRDLSTLFPEPAVAFVRARGGEVRLGAPVRDLAGLHAAFRAVIVAVGPHQLKALLPGAPSFRFQPIYTCYLRYPPDVRLAFPMLGLARGLVQWVFDRGALTGEAGLLACIISATGDHQQMTQQELAGHCHRELAEILPALPAPLAHRVIAEKRATVSCTPGWNPVVPASGMLFAGDYLDPEYPPTLEAAARSGIRAARRILEGA